MMTSKTSSAEATSVDTPLTPPDITVEDVADDTSDSTCFESYSHSSDCENNAFAFDDKDGLADDLQLLLTMPEFCDVLFTLGPEKKHVYGVKAILAARSRVFHQQLHTPSCLGGNPRRRRTSIGDNIKGTLKSIAVSRRTSTADSPETVGVGKYQTIVVEEFEPVVFEKLIEFIHSGRICITPEILLGILNAGEQYGIEGLKQACTRYCDILLTSQTACIILKTIEKYIHFKATKLVLNKVLHYVDQNIEEMTAHQEFFNLPRDVILLLLSREQLEISEATKFRVAFGWSRRQLESDDLEKLREFLLPFMKCIKFHEIPAVTLMRLVKPLNIISDEVLIHALAYQADPSSIDLGTVANQRRYSNLSLQEHLALPEVKRKQSSSSDRGDTGALQTKK